MEDSELPANFGRACAREIVPDHNLCGWRQLHQRRIPLKYNRRGVPSDGRDSDDLDQRFDLDRHPDADGLWRIGQRTHSAIH